MQLITNVIMFPIKLTVLLFFIEVFGKTFIKHTILGKLSWTFVKEFGKLGKLFIKYFKKWTKILYKESKSVYSLSVERFRNLVNDELYDEEQQEVSNNTKVIDLSEYLEGQKKTAEIIRK